MDKVLTKVENTLNHRFKGAQLSLRRLRRNGPIGGSLIWKGFAGKPQIDRQTDLRHEIDASLAPDERLQVSFILTVTPDEQMAMTRKNAG